MNAGAVKKLFVVTVVVVASLSGCRGGDSEQPPVHLIHNMDTQEKVKAYRKDTSGVFADGRGMRVPVEGTVAQGHLNEDDLLHHGVDDKGQPARACPPQVLDANGKILESVAERGRDRYGIYCTPCHGPLGDGKGIVATRGLPVPPANLLDDARKTMASGKLYAAMAVGVNNGNMPSYATQIPVEDRWAIVAHMRKNLQNTDCAGAPPVEVKCDKVSVECGAGLYKQRICVTCHTTDGTKLVGPSFKGLWGKTESTSAGDVVVDEAYVMESITNPGAKIVTGYPPAMPPVVPPLNEVEMKSILLYLQSLK